MDLQNPRDRLKAYLAQWLKRLPLPERAKPSEFDRKDGDDPAKRKKIVQEIRPGVEPAYIRTPFYTGQQLVQGWTAKATRVEAFDHAAETTKIKAQQEIDRFKTDRARATARMVVDDVAALIEENDARREQALVEWQSRLDRITNARLPAPSEVSQAVNQFLINALASYKRDKEEITEFRRIGMIHAATLDIEAPETIVPEERRIGWTPDAHVHFNKAARQAPLDPLAQFNAAARPEPETERVSESPAEANPTPAEETSTAPQPEPEPIDWVAEFKAKAKDMPQTPSSPGIDV